MTARKEPNLPQLYAQLQASGGEGNFDKCLELVEKILSVSPQDKEALQFKVTCLVHCSQFIAALLLCDQLSECEFERAYCLYRLERWEESLVLLNRLPPELLSVRELKAQILYKQESFTEAAAILCELCDSVSDDFSSDREANRLAALVSNGYSDALSGKTMEQWFNVACCYLTAEKWNQALSALGECEELGRAALLEEGCSEEEITEELNVVRVQYAYTLQRQGHTQKALDIYNAILKSRPADVTQTIVASNNTIALRKDKDVFDSRKKLKVLVAEGSSKRFTQHQKLSILYNRALFALGTNQLEACRNLIDELESLFPGSSRVSLCRAALLIRERRSVAAVKALDSSSSMSDITVTLTLAQLHLIEGRSSLALSCIKAWPDLSRRVGVLSAAVSLATALGEVDTAIQLLDTALIHWRQSLSTDTCQQLIMETARYKLAHNRPIEAAKLLEELHKTAPHDIKVSALLVSAYSRYSPALAEELGASLVTPSNNNSSILNVDTLEQMPSFKHSRRMPTKAPSKDKTTSVLKTPRKKKRKPRLPQNVDPNVHVDKERWLPLRERSYFRRGKKKGFIGSARGSQGATLASASLMAALDANKPKTSSAEPTGAESASPQAKPVVHAVHAQKKKQKKKKGKW